MSVREIPSDMVPGFNIVLQILGSIDGDVSVTATADDKDIEGYLLILTGRGRKGRAVLSYELLDDIRDNKQSPRSGYTQELLGKLTKVLREAVEGMA